MSERAVKIAVLCPSEIARRRFMPALEDVDGAQFAGIAYATPDERCVTGGTVDETSVERSRRQQAAAEEFVSEFGGQVWGGFGALLEDPSVDAVYIPLPPALHYPWAKRALEAGKHVMLEKPFALSLEEAQELTSMARERNLAVHENYMFAFHSQIDYLRASIADGAVGDVRMVRVDFGFPFRGASDFRYSPSLGGGALFDCGGYTLKLASMLLGPNAFLKTAAFGYGRDLEVDLFGSATLENDDGAVAQVSFGMDNDYRCDVDVWGSQGTLRSGRILTAPAGFQPTFVVSRNGESETVMLEPDDSFKKSIEHFLRCIADGETAAQQRDDMLRQAALVDSFLQAAAHK